MKGVLIVLLFSIASAYAMEDDGRRRFNPQSRSERARNKEARDKKGRGRNNIDLPSNRVMPTPLHNVQTAQEARRLVEENPQMVHARDEHGATPLHYAQNQAIALVLLEAGADLKARDHVGRTALHRARNSKIASCLIDRRVEIDVYDGFGRNPLHYVRTVGSVKLYESCLNVNQPDRLGNTPLHTAREYKVIKALLDGNADVNAVNNDGHTALALQARRERKGQLSIKKSVIGLLLASGARINLTDSQQVFAVTQSVDNVLIRACLLNNLPVLEAALANPDFNIDGEWYGLTPLRAAIYQDHEKIIEKLIECNVEITLNDVELAARLGHAQIEGALRRELELLTLGGESAESCVLRLIAPQEGDVTFPPGFLEGFEGARPILFGDFDSLI